LVAVAMAVVSLPAGDRALGRSLIEEGIVSVEHLALRTGHATAIAFCASAEWVKVLQQLNLIPKLVAFLDHVMQVFGEMPIPLVDAFSFLLGFANHLVSAIGQFPSSARMLSQGKDAVSRRAIQDVVRAPRASLWPPLPHPRMRLEGERDLAALTLSLAVSHPFAGVSHPIRIPNCHGPRTTSLQALMQALCPRSTSNFKYRGDPAWNGA
jgi:hypothetical protein